MRIESAIRNRSANRASPASRGPGEIAQAVVSMLEVEDRGFVTKMAVWATNPE